MTDDMAQRRRSAIVSSGDSAWLSSAVGGFEDPLAAGDDSLRLVLHPRRRRQPVNNSGKGDSSTTMMMFGDSPTSKVAPPNSIMADSGFDSGPSVPM